jgi:predicted metal-binding protein
VVSARAEIIACETCGGAPLPPLDRDGPTRGAQLIAHLQRELAGREEGAIEVSSTRCLWACKKSCAVMLRSPGRVGYVLVELEPNESSARALVDYASLYLRSEDGAVPYRSWPQELKGHFHCRLPRLTSTSDTHNPFIARGDEDPSP